MAEKVRIYNVPFYPLPFLDPPEQNSGEEIVETSGYMPTQQRIEQMILAGQRLDQARRESYDFDGEIEEDFYDPTRDPNYDMADAFQDGLKVKAKLEEQKKVKKDKESMEKVNQDKSVEKEQKEE